MWNYRSAPAVGGGAGGRVGRRLPATAMVMAVVASLLPIASVFATEHREPPMLWLGQAGADGFDSSVPEATQYGFGRSGDVLYGYRSPDVATEVPQTFLLDACASGGGVWISGINETGSLLQVRLEDAASGLSATLPVADAIGGDGPGPGPVPFLSPLDIACDQLHPPRTTRLPALVGTATYAALGRGCSDFDAPIALTESRPGRGPDTYTMRESQVNRALYTNPLVAVDTSKVFDEVHIITLPDPHDPSQLSGIAIGGPRGILPKGKKLDRAIDALFADQSQVLAEGLVERAAARKAADRLLKGLKVKGKPCTYAIDIDLNGNADPSVAAALGDALLLPGSRLDVDGRFNVDIEWADGSMTALQPVPLFGDPGAGDLGDAGYWFFHPEATDVLVKVLDGCATNDHFWVFAAASTQVDFALAVTDTDTGETHRMDPVPNEHLPTVVDTEAFATCP